MNDSFRYWQEKKIEHAASVSNLTLTLAIGTVAFGLTLLEKKHVIPGASWSPKLFIASQSLLLISAAFAFMGMASRLEDFSATAQAARLRNMTNRNEAQLAEEREIAESAGKRTKFYLICQVSCFALGIASLAAVIIIANTL